MILYAAIHILVVRLDADLLRKNDFRAGFWTTGKLWYYKNKSCLSCKCV